jgi:RNA polymerase sigma-70 factor (ECF subfamily)
VLGRDEAACRQLAHRAKEHLKARRPRFARSREQHERLLGAFLGAVAQGDLDGLQKLLSSDVVAWSDGGGRAKAARNLVRGPDHVARLFIGLAKKGGNDGDVTLETLNGWPGVVLRRDGVAVAVMTCETDGETIFTFQLITNPDKLARL